MSRSDAHALFTPRGGEAEPVFRIGLRPIPMGDWFEGGGVDAPRKDALLAAHPRDVWGELEGSRPGQAEAAEMMANAGIAIEARPRAPPLLAAARAVADDLCLMERRLPHGRETPASWTLTAASLCSPSFFSAVNAVGCDLAALHGPVPGFGRALLPRIARIFDRLAPDVILERRNWSVVSSDALFLPDAAPVRVEEARSTPDGLAARLTVRRERQTLRRLPRTGGLLFTIRIHREPLSDLLAQPTRRAAFAAAWRRVMGAEGAAFRDYKGLAALDPAVRRLIDRD